MEKPYILVRDDMNRELCDVVGKYTDTVYHVDIIDSLQRLIKILQPTAESQLEQARKQYEKSKKEESENDSE